MLIIPDRKLLECLFDLYCNCIEIKISPHACLKDNQGKTSKNLNNLYQLYVSTSLKGQYHAIFINTLKIERRYSVDSSQDIMTKIPLKDYQNAKKLSTDVFAGR